MAGIFYSEFSPEFSYFPDAAKYQPNEGVFKMARCLTRLARARPDVPFLRQGRSRFGARNVQGVGEAQQRGENVAGGLF